MSGWLVLASVTAIRCAPVQAPPVDVILIPEFLSVQPGSGFRVGVRLQIPDGWHIYWTNPGQSGLPTTLAWRLPAAVEYRTTGWPVPAREDSAGLISHTYRGDVALVSSFRVASATAPGTVDLVASLTWGICREICIPQRRKASVSLPIDTLVPRRSTRWEAFYAGAAPRLPAASEDLAIRAVAKGTGLELTIHRRDQLETEVRDATFFPQQRGSAAALLKPQAARGGVVVEIPNQAWQHSPSARVEGVLVLEPGGSFLLDVVVKKIRE